MAHGEHHFAEAGNAGRRFQMPNVRLGGTDEAGCRALGLEHRTQCLHLDRIAEGGTRPVRLDEL